MPAAPKEEAGVKILSIHRSKGLSTRWSFSAAWDGGSTMGICRSRFSFTRGWAWGPRDWTGETMVEFTTLARTGVALALKKELLAEEMRLLYVAMTRAKEKLILTHALGLWAGET